jgi:hypothetical protein
MLGVDPVGAHHTRFRSAPAITSGVAFRAAPAAHSAVRRSVPAAIPTGLERRCHMSQRPFILVRGEDQIAEIRSRAIRLERLCAELAAEVSEGASM